MIDITGQKFGRLTAMYHMERTERYPNHWFCKCECEGKLGGDGTTIVARNRLIGNKTKSCGCLRKENAKKLFTKHGESDSTPTYRTWKVMITRCTNPNIAEYHNYGGRGIKVCERWRKYENFKADMGERLENTTIDRIDVNQGYEPGNCRWATKLEQSKNKRNNIYHEVNGELKTPQQIADMLNIDVKLVHRRWHKGWSLEEILNNKRVNYKKVPKVTDEEMRERYAFKLVAKALEEGKITKPLFCSHPNCQSSKIKAYHLNGKDEANILNVTWFCASHRPSTKFYKAFGKNQTIVEWAEELNMHPTSIEKRIAAGWSIEDALSSGPIYNGKSQVLPSSLENNINNSN